MGSEMCIRDSYCWHSHAWNLRPHITRVAVVPIRVPTPITTSTRSSIHFIENPKKSPLVGELIRPSSHAEDGGQLWINGSVSPHFP